MASVEAMPGVVLPWVEDLFGGIPFLRVLLPLLGLSNQACIILWMIDALCITE